MIVCPACRTGNAEDRATCESCGGSLVPGPTTLQARRAPTERPAVEMPTRTPPSRFRPYIVLGAFVLLVGGGIAFATLGPDACRDRSFTSEAFGYCVDVPAGWAQAPARFGNGATLDGFSDVDGTASILVEAVDLSDTTDLDTWARMVRARDESVGLTPGVATDVVVAGVPAKVWDLTAESEDGTGYRTREVVLVRDAIGWRLTLNETEAGFDGAAAALDELLATWGFR